MEVPSFKVVLLGDSGVGKTCLRSQFVHHIFTNAYKATIGGDYLTTTIEVGKPDNVSIHSSIHSSKQQEPVINTQVNLQIWDTAGQERFNSISQAFYRGTDIVILVYDVTNYESVLSLRNWFKTFIEHCHVTNPGVIIVGNKIDKVNDRCVDLEEIREIITNNTEISVESYIIDWETDLMEICSKKLNEVNDVFKRVAQLGLELMNNDVHHRKIVGFDSIDLKQPKTNSSCFC